MRVSEIRVKRIRVNQGLGVCKERKLEIKTHVVVICIFPEGVFSTMAKVEIAKAIHLQRFCHSGGANSIKSNLHTGQSTNYKSVN